MLNFIRVHVETDSTLNCRPYPECGRIRSQAGEQSLAHDEDNQLLKGATTRLQADLRRQHLLPRRGRPTQSRRRRPSRHRSAILADLLGCQPFARPQPFREVIEAANADIRRQRQTCGMRDGVEPRALVVCCIARLCLPESHARRTRRRRGPRRHDRSNCSSGASGDRGKNNQWLCAGLCQRECHTQSYDDAYARP